MPTANIAAFRTCDIARIDCDTTLRTSDGKPIPCKLNDSVAILYNKNVISDDAVAHLIQTGMHPYDTRVLSITPEEADNFAMPCENPSVADIIRNMSDENLAKLFEYLHIDMSDSANVLRDAVRTVINDTNSNPETTIVNALKAPVN